MIEQKNKKMRILSHKKQINIHVPLPSRNSIEVTEKINIAMSAACLTVGFFTESKVFLTLGAISGFSAIVSHIAKETF